MSHIGITLSCRDEWSRQSASNLRTSSFQDHLMIHAYMGLPTYYVNLPSIIYNTLTRFISHTHLRNLDYIILLLYVTAMQSIENTGSDADFATVYSLVTKIDNVLLSKTIYDAVSKVQPLRSIVGLPFLPGSAFTKDEELEIIHQFEFNVNPSKYPAPYNDGGESRMYDLFLATVYSAFPPIFQCSFIADIKNITDASAVAAVHGSKCLQVQDYTAYYPASCTEEASYTVVANGKEWAANMVYMPANTLVEKDYYTNEWKNYNPEKNPLPDKGQYNAYFIASESPCNGDCLISRLCYWTDTGEVIGAYTVVDEMPDNYSPIGGSLSDPNPVQAEQQASPKEGAAQDSIAPVPVCGLQAIYPKYYSIYSSTEDLLRNVNVNVYDPYVLNAYCSEYDPSLANDSEFATSFDIPYEGENAKYSWMPVTMCQYTYTGESIEDVKVAIRINKFKTKAEIVEDGTTKIVDKYIGLPTALRIKLKGKYRPAIRKVWYDAIFQTLRHCMGYIPSGDDYSSESFALGNTWDTSIQTFIQGCANYGAMAYNAPTFRAENNLTANYKSTNWLDLWTEQYLLGRKGIICEGSNVGGNNDSYEEAGGLCVISVDHQAQQNPGSQKYCQYAYTKEKLHLPWHGGCANTICDPTGENESGSDSSSEKQNTNKLAAHGYTFNILNDLYDTIITHKIEEHSLCSDVKVLDMGFDVESYAYSEGTDTYFSAGNLLEIYKTYITGYSAIDVYNTPHFLFISNMLYSALQESYPLLNPGVYIDGPTCRDPKCYEYTYADLYFYSAGSLVNELVVNSDIVADKDYSLILKYSTEEDSTYITTNPEEYVWLDYSIKYQTATTTTQQLRGSCDGTSNNNKTDAVITAISTSETNQNTYYITLNPAEVLSDHHNWVVSNYHIYAGIPVLTRLDRLRINLAGCDALLTPAWEIGMLAKKPVEAIAAAGGTQVFTKIDWTWINPDGTQTQQTIMELPAEYYSMLLNSDIPTMSTMEMNVLRPRAYGMFKCIESSSIENSNNSDEKWYPLYKSTGGYVELRATLLKNGNNIYATTKTYHKGDFTYSIDVTDSTTLARQFYGLIALDIIVHPYGDPTTGDAALASFGAEALRTSMDTVMNWEVDYEQVEGSTEHVEQGNIIFKTYSASPDETGCAEIYSKALQANKVITINVSGIN